MSARGTVTLRDVTEADLPVFFAFEQDPVANEMAAFPARDRDAFMKHWKTNILGNDTGRKRTILLDGEVVGNMLSWEQSGDRLVGYWIGRDYWGRGVATRALELFLVEVNERPLPRVRRRAQRGLDPGAGEVRVPGSCVHETVG